MRNLLRAIITLKETGHQRRTQRSEGMGLANDIYAQVGLVMLVGLLGKNAVLIVELAVQKHHQGMAFIAGLIPLGRATGPGAVGNHTIGASALGGMLFGTIFGVMIVPGLYYIFGTLAEGRSLVREEEDTSVTEEVAAHHV